LSLKLSQTTNALTEKIIGCAYDVLNSLGHGFVEKVYENALAVELKGKGLKVVQQALIPVRYRGVPAGDYVADMLAEGEVLVELKASSALDDAHYAQCLNYLKATGLEVCLLFNFGRPKLQLRRILSYPEWVANEQNV